MAECSQLFPVGFVRNEWEIHSGAWHVGSFVQPSSCQAVVACIAYGRQGAHASAITLPVTCQVSALRTILGSVHGSFVRINGDIVYEEVHLQHGDVIEFHAVESVQSFSLTKTHKKVQICLDASIQFGSSVFVEDEDAHEVLPMPAVCASLQSHDEWEFKFIPEGLNLHKMTLEALYLQQELIPSIEDDLELYVDGATHGDISAWAVVAVSKSDQGRSFCGCIGGVTKFKVDPHIGLVLTVIRTSMQN